MGTFRVPIEVASLTGTEIERFEALADTGASHTCLPRDRLDALGAEVDERWPFVLADGREVYCGIGWIRIGIGGKTQPTLVVFGEPGSDPLLGAVTLEEFRLGVDPVSQRLVPVPGLLKRSA